MPSASEASVVLSGRLFAAGSAACADATLSIDEHGLLRLDCGLQQEHLDATTLAWGDRIGRAPLRIELPDGRIFETSLHDTASRLRQQLYGRAPHNVLFYLERVHPRLLLLFVVAIALMFAGVRWGVPWTADLAARLVPVSVEQRIGTGVMQTLDYAVFKPSTLPPKQQQQVQAVFDDLTRNQVNLEHTLQLHFRKGDTIGANALALPGGDIVITDELIEMASSQDEIAGVLAHEIGHVHHRHGLRRMARAVGLSAVLMMMTGDISSMVSDTAAMGAGLLDLAYSRDFERDADTHAAELMQASGRDPAALAHMLERLEKSHPDKLSLPDWTASHPATEERIRRLRETLQTHPAD